MKSFISQSYSCSNCKEICELLYKCSCSLLICKECLVKTEKCLNCGENYKGEHKLEKVNCFMLKNLNCFPRDKKKKPNLELDKKIEKDNYFDQIIERRKRRSFYEMENGMAYEEDNKEYINLKKLGFNYFPCLNFPKKITNPEIPDKLIKFK